ncbi:hypothetical protein FS749_004724 [Ceratobasidium sp. UAMH 11750]|nr:hypothetical protein FS749_004724 [Ceratobasidium sp. UAMH 11750]
MARSLLFTLSFLVLSGIAALQPCGDQQLWITAYTSAVSTFTFNGGTLTNVSTTFDAGYQPGWVAKHPWLHVLYIPARGQTEGGISAWTYDDHGTISKIAIGHTHGLSAVHCEVSGDGKTLAVPNMQVALHKPPQLTLTPYSFQPSHGANLAVFTVRPNGTFAKDPTTMFTFPFYRVGPNVKEQSASRPHQARFDRSSRFMYVPNLGTDRMHVFRVLGAGDLRQLDDVMLPSGSGPRYVGLSPSLRI